MPGNHENYDEDPVVYCPRCYSLKIKHVDVTDTDCCMECGCTEVKETDIETWEKMYKERYGHKYVEKNNDPRSSIYFKMSVPEIQNKLLESDVLMTIVHRLYPKFPKGLSRFDTVLLFVDKLCHDNMLDDLKYIFYEMNHTK